jgi:hypothetical protein
MPTNSFEPDTVVVKAHSRKPPARKPAGSFEEESVSHGGGASFEEPAQTAFGQPIHQTRQMIDLATMLGAGVASLAAPEAAGPLLGGRLAAAAPAIGGMVSRGAMALGGGALAHGLANSEAGGQDPNADIRAGLEQAGYSLTGDAFAGTAKLGSRAAMGAAVRYTPEVAQTAIREGITATKQGVAKLMSKLGEYGDRTLSMLRHSTAQGTRFEPVAFLTGAEQSLATKLAENRTPEAMRDLKVFQDLSSDFLRRNPRALTPVQLQQLKRDGEDLAAPIWKKIARKEEVDGTSLAKARWYKAISDYARDQLEKTTPDMIDPRTGKILSLSEANAATSELIKLRQVLAPDVRSERGFMARVAERATSPLGRTLTGAGTGAAVGALLPGDRAQHGIEGALTGAAVGSPQAMSLLALALQNPGLLALLRQSPRLAMQAAHE